MIIYMNLKQTTMNNLTKEQVSILKEVLYDFLDENDHREDVRDILISLQTKYE